jgi:hypothetical protein
MQRPTVDWAEAKLLDWGLTAPEATAHLRPDSCVPRKALRIPWELDDFDAGGVKNAS